MWTEVPINFKNRTREKKKFFFYKLNNRYSHDMNFFPRSFLRCSSRDLSFSHIKIKQIIRYHNSEQAFRTGHPFPQPISRRESNEIKSITELYYFKVFFLTKSHAFNSFRCWIEEKRIPFGNRWNRSARLGREH